MARTEPSLVVCDAGPLIHLDELRCLDLLRGLGKILIPREVWTEVVRHRPELTLDGLPDAQVDKAIAAAPSARLIAMSDSFDLDAGERAALALIEGVSAGLFLCDDAAARLAAESLGIAVRGTIGILVRSIRVASRTRQEVIGLLRQIPRKSSLHISHQLLETITAEVETVPPES
jgi:predicted nucleic acid-binding protein